jgi:voltage-gated potassium channel
VVSSGSISPRRGSSLPDDDVLGLPPGYSPRTLSTASALVGAFLFILGIVSAYVPSPDIYPGILPGYEPPFEAVAGVLLLAVSFGLRQRSRIAWFFSTIAPAVTIGIAALSPDVFSFAGAAVSLLLFAFMYPSRIRFYRGAIFGAETAQYAVLLGALSSLLYGIVGGRLLGGDFAPAPGIRTWSQSLYFTVATISTNGSDYVPQTDEARLYTVILILFGVSAFLSAVVAFFVPFLEQRLERVANRLERSQMEQMNDHVVVCGTSPEVRAIVEAFRDRHVPTVVLGTDAGAISQLDAEGFRTHLGESSTEEALAEVGIARARALIAADSSDAENLLTVITVRSMLPTIPIVAIASAAASIPKLRKAGATEVISLISVAARLVIDAALRRNDGTAGPPPQSR